MKKRAVNISQIAKLANVHPSTVSRALNGSPRVKPETREWIKEIAKEHGYIPDAIARSLSEGQTLTLGMIVPEISNTFYAHIVDEIEAIMGIRGYSLILSASGFDPEREEKAIMAMVSKRVDALVVCAPTRTSEAKLSELASRLPVILCDTRYKDSQIDSIYVDEYAGIRQAVQYLRDSGHRRIGFIADSVTQRRMHVFRQVMAECGMSIDEACLYSGEETAVVSGYQGLYTLAARHSIPDAICTARDNIAVGVMRAAIELGINIPEQLSIIGYDDISISNYLYRKLSTIRQPADEIGQNVANLLIHKLDRDQESTSMVSVCLTPKLILRESTLPRSASLEQKLSQTGGHPDS